MPHVALLIAFEVAAVILAVVCAPIAVLFAKWDNEATTFTGGTPDNGPATVRGDLPASAIHQDRLYSE